MNTIYISVCVIVVFLMATVMYAKMFAIMDALDKVEKELDFCKQELEEVNRIVNNNF